MHKIRFVMAQVLVIAGMTVSVMAADISQTEFLDKLKQTHPLFEKEELRSAIEKKKRESFLGSEDWNIRSSAFLSHDEPSFAIAGPEKTNALTVGGGVDRKFWSTGGTLTASYQSSYIDLTVDPFLQIPGSYFENRLAVTYTHPLMRNKGGSLDRLQYDLSQYDIDLSEVVALENEEIFLAGSAAKFLDWVLLVEQHKIVVERLRLSEEELARTRDKRASNLIDEVDVIRAEDAVLVANQNLLLIESRSKALQSELAVLTQDHELNEMTPDFDLYHTTSLPTLPEAANQLRTNSRLLKTIAIRIDQLKLVRSGLEDQGKTDLTIVVQLGLKNAEESYRKSLVADIPEARIGLQLSFPSGNRTVKANITRTDLESLQLEKQLEELTIGLTSSAANLLTQAVALEAVLELNIEQIESAGRKTIEELKLYEQGRGELTFVIQSRDSEQAARLTYALNALTYHKLLLNFYELADQLHQ